MDTALLYGLTSIPDLRTTVQVQAENRLDLAIPLSEVET